MAAVTPMMRQYQEAKRACGDALLLFRMGDFYEMFFDDAKVAARTLHLALTSRDKGAGGVPMAGFPHHQLESYLGKLIAAGLRAAVCEQVEDPKLAKGLVKREVTRIVTPGTVTDDALLDPRRSNFLAAVSSGDPLGLAWVELSTGRFLAAGFPAAALADQLARIAPAECLLSEDAPPLARGQDERMMVTRRPGWAFSLSAARQALAKHFRTAGLEGFGFGDGAADDQAIAAAGAVLDYLAETQKTSLEHIDRLVPYRTSGTLEIDQASRRSLELTRTIRDGRREGSLLAVLDSTATAMGARLLADWLANPLAEAAAIVARHEAVEELVDEAALAADLRDALRRVYDTQRLLARVTTGRASPRDLGFLGRTLRALPALKAKLTAAEEPPVEPIGGRDRPVRRFAGQAGRGAGGGVPLGQPRGRLHPRRLPSAAGRAAGIGPRRQAVDRPLPGAGIAADRHPLAQGRLQQGLRLLPGDHQRAPRRIPEDYIRKQTVKNAERYITPELKEYEEKVLTADEKSKEMEYELFLELREAVSASRRRLQGTAAVLAQLDVLVALAELARQRNYCRPEIVEEPLLAILDGRHPVLDVLEPEGTFVPNDVTAGRRRAISS